MMQLLEIVCIERTSSQVISDLLNVGKKIKKTPIVVGNCISFVVNRMFYPYTQATLMLVEHGVDIYQINQAITKFEMPMRLFKYFLVVILSSLPFRNIIRTNKIAFILEYRNKQVFQR